MAKEKERRTAHILFVEHDKTAKDISALVNVSEKTLSAWINKYGWKQERDARVLSPYKRQENIRQIITSLSEERLALQRSLRHLPGDALSDENPHRASEIRSAISKIDDAVSKWNKTLDNMTAEARISLTTYLSVMDGIFNALRCYDAALYVKTIDFQEEHVREITEKLA